LYAVSVNELHPICIYVRMVVVKANGDNRSFVALLIKSFQAVIPMYLYFIFQLTKQMLMKLSVVFYIKKVFWYITAPYNACFSWSSGQTYTKLSLKYASDQFQY
jgi:hypothetical protein